MSIESARAQMEREREHAKKVAAQAAKYDRRQAREQAAERAEAAAVAKRVAQAEALLRDAFWGLNYASSRTTAIRQEFAAADVVRAQLLGKLKKERIKRRALAAHLGLKIINLEGALGARPQSDPMLLEENKRLIFRLNEANASIAQLQREKAEAKDSKSAEELELIAELDRMSYELDKADEETARLKKALTEAKAELQAARNQRDEIVRLHSGKAIVAATAQQQLRTLRGEAENLARRIDAVIARVDNGDKVD